MAWEPFSLHFKQLYDGGAYRYLDRCGEFLSLVEKDLGAVPSEIVVTGGKFEIPDHGIRCEVSPTEFAAAQIYSPDPAVFLETCNTLQAIVAEYFTPGSISSNGFAARWVWPVSTEEELFALSLGRFVEGPNELSRLFGMESMFQKVENHFRAGSLQLHVRIAPITFDPVQGVVRAAPAGANRQEKKKVERQNKQSARIKATAPYALQLELDLVEADPPESKLDGHFEKLMAFCKTACTNLLFK